jgi:hypothetical protein
MSGTIVVTKIQREIVRVTEPAEREVIRISQPAARETVRVVAEGPQGPQGPQGPTGGMAWESTNW